MNEVDIMKGKRVFTESEINRLRSIIRKKVISSRNEQKKIRNEIRKIGFYFSDYSNKKGYTVDDLESLISDGSIQIIGKEFKSENRVRINSVSNKYHLERKQRHSLKEKSTKTWQKPEIVISLESFEKPEFGLSPVIHSEVKFLILGTFPAKESICANFYYENQIKRFWEEALKVIGNFANLNIPERKKLLLQKNIGLWDIFEVAERGESNQDLALKKAKFNPIQKFVEMYPSIKYILFNGGNAYYWLKEDQPDLFENPNYCYKRLQSSSGANRSFNQGADWDEFFHKYYTF